MLKKLSNSVVGRTYNYKVLLRDRYKQFRKQYVKLGPPKQVIWILGCQRSGTTLLERMFRNDIDSHVFGEFSDLTVGPKKTVLRPLNEVGEIVCGLNASYVVVRPLFESDRALELLENFPGSIAVWLFRNPDSVVRSMVNKWGGEFFSVSRTVESDENGCWRMESLYSDLVRRSDQYRSLEEQSYQLYAGYWLRRNRIAIDLNSDGNKDILFLNYSELIQRPGDCISRIMYRANLNGLWSGFQTDARPLRAEHSDEIVLPTDLRQECNLAYDKLTQLGNVDFPKNMGARS